MTAGIAGHRHRWSTVSSHQVSDGLVVYQRCACRSWRVVSTPPEPVAYARVNQLPQTRF